MALPLAFYAIVFILSLVRPFWGFVGLVCSVLIRFQDRFPEIVVIKPFALLLLGLTIGCYIHRDKLANKNWRQDKLLLALIGVSVVGLLLLARSALIAETWMFITVISMYFFASRLVQNKNHYLILFLAMAACICFMGYEAIVSVNLLGENSPHIDPKTYRWNGLGYYANANEFGQLMIATVPYLLAIILMRKNFILMILAAAMMSLMVYVMLKTGSRTVMITFALMIVLSFVLRGRGNVIKQGLLGGVAGLIILVGLAYTPGPIKERLSTVLEASEDESFQGRVRSWGYGIDMVTWYPFTGVGKGQWMEYHGLMPHNSYIQVLAELGPLGLVLFLWVLVQCFKDALPMILGRGNNSPPGKANAANLWEEDAVDSEDEHGIFGDEKDDVTDTAKAQSIHTRDDDDERSIAIATIVTLIAWMLYIFLGNQAYAVWTYFYIGLCAALLNLPSYQKYLQQDKKPASIWEIDEQAESQETTQGVQV